MLSDDETVSTEVQEAFQAYEKALLDNDVDKLIQAFWNDPKAVRLTADGGQYGFEDIAAFRRARDVGDVPRDITRLEILVMGPNIGVVNSEYKRHGSGRLGAQSHVWLRTDAGWRIAAAYVSLAAES